MLSTKFILIVLLIFIGYLNINCEPTIEECNKVWNSEEIFNYTDCICYQEDLICKYALQVHFTCEYDTLKDYFTNLKSCDVILPDCSSNNNNKCKIGMCNCFKSLIGCMNENKCTPVKESTITKRDSSVNQFSGINEFVTENIYKK